MEPHTVIVDELDIRAAGPAVSYRARSLELEDSPVHPRTTQLDADSLDEAVGEDIVDDDAVRLYVSY